MGIEIVREIVNGKVYDTGTSTQVAKIIDRSVQPHGRWTYLYRTSKGSWFKYLGPTIFPDRDASFLPMDDEAAGKWLLKYSKVSELKKYFPDLIEDA